MGTLRNGERTGREVRLERHCLWVGDSRVPLLGGQVDYWLHPSYAWRDLLVATRDAGLAMVACYVPWNFHELADGSFDFDGATDPQRDLTGFLKAASEVGLWVFIRPGPWIYNHYRDGGVPLSASRYHRLDDRFLRRAHRYLAAVCAVLRPFLATNGGPIVLCQPDNEIDPLPTLRGTSGSDAPQDDPVGPTYFEQTIAGPTEDPASLRSWLARKYARIEAFNRIHGTAYEDWDSITPPRAISSSRPHWNRDLLGYMEWYTHEYATVIAAALRDEGIDVPMTLNTFNDLEPQNTVLLSTVTDLIGGDYWGRNLMPWEKVMRVSRHMRLLRTATPTPWSPEFQSITAGELIEVEGVVTPENARYLCLLGMLCGLKGWNWYAFAERSVLYFAPVNNHGGRVSPYYEAFRNMNRLFLDLDWPAFEPIVDGALLFHRTQAWAEMQYAKPLTEPFYTHSEHHAGAWMETFERLQVMDVDVDVLDTASPSAIRPTPRIAFYRGPARLAEREQHFLQELARAGTNLVFLSTPPVRFPDGTPSASFASVPSPEGVRPGLRDGIIASAGKEYLASTDFVALFPEDVVGREDIERVLRCDDGVCGFVMRYEEARAIVLGFTPPDDLLFDLLDEFGKGVAVRSPHPGVLTSAWIRTGRRAIVVLNTLEHALTTTLTVNTDRLGLDQKAVYGVVHRLSGQRMRSRGADLSEIRLEMNAKSGEIVEVFD